MALSADQGVLYSMNTSSSISQLLNLRILILALGEAQHFGWWKSQFLSPTGISFLDRVYPRTKFAAAIRSAMRSAQKVHDTGIGKGEVVHLFRLDINTESEIDELCKEAAQGYASHFLPILADRTRLIEELGLLAKGKNGPQQVGPVYLEGSPRNQVGLLVACYLNGFCQNTPVFPYFGVNG